MAFLQRTLYCGPASAGVSQIFNRGRLNNIDTWFGKKTIYYTHKARVAIHRACRLLGIGAGNEVLAPSYNCGSEIDALLNSGVSLSLYRIDKSARIDIADLRQRITDKTKAIYITHYFGFPQPIAQIKRLCEEKGIYLVEDCALSLFISCNGKTKLGSAGDISVFNFPKTLPVPDGGLLVVNNADLATDSWFMLAPRFGVILRSMLPFLKRGVLRVSSGTGLLYRLLWSALKRTQTFLDIDTEKKTKYPDIPSSYYYDEQLNDRRISTITKYMLPRFNVSVIVKKRRENYAKFLRLLSDVRGIKPLYTDLPEEVSPLHFPILIKNRDIICRKLNEFSISATAWWAGYHRDLPWDGFPDACFLKDNLLTLPVHQQLSGKHIKFIAEKVINLIANV